jgi:dTMP kinase
MNGTLLTLEGLEGAGKSSLVAAIEARLRARGVDVVSTREPGGTPLGEEIRDALLRRRDEPVDALAELLLVCAARAQHVSAVIRPALAAGRCVLCDRFVDATYAYQGGGRSLPHEAIAALERLVHADVRPDLTLYFDVPPARGLQRIAGRAQDRFEAAGLPFLERVRAAYLHRAAGDPARVRVVDASRDAAAVRDDALATVDAFIDRWVR